MAVPEQTPYSEHTGNGVTTSFSLGFICESKDHLIVLVDEIEPPIATWSLSGGNVVFATAPAVGKKITLQRNTPFGRTANYQSFNNSFRPQTVNVDFDRIWWKLQELGVADWLMKLYVDRLHQQQEQKINDLKGYVDDRDDELRAYLLEEIRKQGVALDQLEDYYNYLMQQLAQVAINKGWNASFIVSADGSTQQEINDFGGAKWWDKPLGYGVGATVKLENGDIARSLLANNIKNPNDPDIEGWINLTKTGDLIDTRLYGLRVNTALDQTAAIHAAFAANPKANNFYIPSGTIKANVVYPRAFLNLVGDSMLTTIIEPFDLTKAAVSFGKKLYPAIHKLSLNAGQDFTGVNLLDATDSRYMILEEFDIKKTIKAGETHKYETVLIDQRLVVTTWTGYNTLNTVRATYGAYGYLSDVEKLNSVLSMKSCVFAENGYFGIKTNIENGSMLSMDVSGNGTLQPSGTYDESQYGGMYLSGENSVVLGCWNEYNSAAGINFSENNIYFHPEKANNIVYNFGRNSRGTNGIKVFSRTQGQLINVSQADKATDDGLGRARPAQLLKNGNFKYFNSASRPRGWGGSFNGTVTQETSDLPSGYNTGIKIISSAAGVTNCIQDIYNSTNIAGSLIKDISKWVGREVTFSFWLKNIGTDAASVRGGIATDASAYFGDGNYFATSEVGQWRKFICSRKITGTETRISFGFRVVGVGEGVIVTGASASDDCRVLDSQPKAITEDGGEIYGSLEVNGVISQNGDPLVGRPFQIDTNGLQTATTPINTTGKYAGKFAWNANDSKLYYATGATATSQWKSIDGVTTITPV